MTVTYERLIYTAGTIKLTDELRQCRRILIYADLLRKPPSAIYQNERMNPPKQFLGYVSLMIDDYVAKVYPLEYDHQIVLEWDNLEYQVYKTVVCTGALIIDGLVALGSAMTPPAILLPVTPDPPSFPGCPYLWLKFKLEPLTRIKVTAFGEETIGCDGATFTATVPDLPPPPTPYPPEQALDEDPPRSEPYPDENPGDTKPADENDPDSGLTPPEFPQGDRCSGYRVFYNVFDVGGGDLAGYQDHFGEIEFVGQDPSNLNRLIIISHGQIITPGSLCSPTPMTYGASSSSAGLNMDTFSYSIVPL